MKHKLITLDGNTAAAHTAYHLSENITIYPITPSSVMGELADLWAFQEKKNIWGAIPFVAEMQSEAGAAGAVHGSLQRGALTTTFTASQGLLLMLPNMFKIAGELTPAVFNVSARSVATHALSIFGDHSDVMAARTTGFALLAAASVQEAMDFPLIAQAASLKSRIPFLHFFDGFRTSHEISKVEMLENEEMEKMINDELIYQHRARALSPERPFIRGTAQNPDVFFQAREGSNPFYDKCADITEETMKEFKDITGREYHLFQYEGAPDAEYIIILMGSGCETVHETVEHLVEKGEKVGVIKVRLFRPFSIKHLYNAIPETAKKLCVLDRTKEPGSAGEPLYIEVLSGINEYMSENNIDRKIKVVGGRYGLSSKEFTPAMVMGVFDEIKKEKPMNHFTVGINDDVTNKSIKYPEHFHIEPADRVRAVFYGLGSDGTVSANKSSIKIIGEETDNFAQGYFVYDSRKAGSLTISHLRFGKDPIHSPYLIEKANFIGCHQFTFLEKYDVLKHAEDNAVLLLNSPYPAEEVWDKIPVEVQKNIIDKKIKVYSINAYQIAKETGLGVRINTVMQTAFFLLSKILPEDVAIDKIKQFIKKSYGTKGEEILSKNNKAVELAKESIEEIKVPLKAEGTIRKKDTVSAKAPKFVREVTAKMIAQEGDDIPVSAFDPDGTFPSGTTKWEKRNIAQEIPEWDPDTCIQCGNCALVCPHAVIRSKVFSPELLANAPENFKSTDSKIKDFQGLKFTLQISPEDCTGCGLCVETCPAKNKKEPGKKAINMVPVENIQEQEKKNWEFFENIPLVDREKLELNRIRDLQFTQPLFEFSGACAGCGETPYVKLISQLFGDRMIVANATGCSSIYGGNLPATPWTFNQDGRGPAWSNSLFEDNAEFGYGLRLAIDQQKIMAINLVEKLKNDIGESLANELMNAEQSNDEEIQKQRERVAQLHKKLENISKEEARQLDSLAEALVKKSVWILGGDGWAYDIGYGGLDHVIAQKQNVNILVLDTEVYSNTGGQMSKATPLGAVAKFAAGGKQTAKKDLAMMAVNYGTAYVARIALGANMNQAIKVFREAEAYDGPSIIVAYSHCAGHGYDLRNGLKQQKAAVASGYWPLMHYNPELKKEGKNPFVLDSKAPSIPLKDYIYAENRYRILTYSKPEIAKEYYKKAQEEVMNRWKIYEKWAKNENSKE
ncbi:MAG: pyruvate:ferredoxin (flavodoxin) oxidoreductase [Atribacterota bacterium]|jgi:pyruvate-ferredoxin/flavodoxin oxidoreductase|nr:pyruvate:ferredoxin (flavodoxin) oxidoreductase [Atribacterota bacterium]MDD3641151.1 pyruvate:ferredoxin (flavodoxin) oxidoreductase [Atribacterota bacterium]MDD4288775.1 pyruvate:ferredoxin (flavodoxin) oxidoreductase [Atribacterota bacterium]MDD4764933.1 pyruvate:ferredoxin (flavodoxin) oxidoreductase [Atribacterota bacterium]